MAGFRSVGEWVDAAEGGQNWISSFRKGFPGGIAGGWCDISAGGGSYPPNYFASSPLVAAAMPEQKGIWTPRTNSDQTLKDFSVMCSAASATSTATDGLHGVLCDYLMYYPFVDLTSTDLQEFDNTVELSRYSDGAGVRVLALMQTPNGNYSNPNITMEYVNQSGDTKTVTGNLQYGAYSQYSAFAPQINISNVANVPFWPLANGDYGVRRINSVQLSGNWGGLAAFVLVKPITMFANIQAARRTTTGNLDSFGAPSQEISLLHAIKAPVIKNGAYLTPLLRIPASGAGGAVLTGTIETVWN